MNTRINQGDGSSLRSELNDIGFDDGEIDSLMDAIAEDGDRPNRKVGERVGAWIGGKVQDMATGVKNLAIATAPALIEKAMPATTAGSDEMPPRLFTLGAANGGWVESFHVVIH